MDKLGEASQGPSPAPDNQSRSEQLGAPKLGLPSQFPDKLMALLENKTAPDALWWLQDMGTVKGVFAINRKVFTEKVLDLAFNGNKWPSITRNFNRWGYRNLSYPNLPPHTSAYHHPFFQPGQPELLKSMTKNKSHAKTSIQQSEKKKKPSEQKTIEPEEKSGSDSPERRSSASLPGLSTASGQLLPSSSSSQQTLRDSLLLAGVPAPAEALRRLSIPAVSVGAARADPAGAEGKQGSPVFSPQNQVPSSRRGPEDAHMDSNAARGSSGFELFPNQQLQDVLLPNMTTNLDSQAMLQSILSQQEGLDNMVQPQAQSFSNTLQSSFNHTDAALLEQLRRQEALFALPPQPSPQPQTQLLNLQEIELQQMLQHQTIIQTPPRTAPQRARLPSIDVSLLVPPTNPQQQQQLQQPPIPPFVAAPNQMQLSIQPQPPTALPQSQSDLLSTASQMQQQQLMMNPQLQPNPIGQNLNPAGPNLWSQWGARQPDDSIVANLVQRTQERQNNNQPSPQDEEDCKQS